ncbi:hypothetical protein [Jeongeupia sp. USM3]|uniref:hypothetical protein n=1 Tax=Jeongeupia sp. USM3 TaxID=1906741 RepID=UPI00089E07FD|nr:hypothetical protein [Jeongeupia sp. USM3]AOY00120.1 hypothetical protein BJP62_06435 [Jeongeupia sp. USM3]
MNLLIHPNAQNDIRALLAADVNGVGKLLALLSAIRADPALIDRLNIQGEDIELDELGKVNALKMQAVKKIADIWRLKAWDSGNAAIPYRLLYGFFPAGQYRRAPQIHILAAAARNAYNYEPDHHLTRRVLADYRDLV